MQRADDRVRGAALLACMVSMLAIAAALGGCDDPLERARKEAIRERLAFEKQMRRARRRAEAAARARRRETARARTGAQAGRGPREAQLAGALARHARGGVGDGSAAGKAGIEVVDLPTVGKGRLERVPGKPEAWAWSFRSGHVRPRDLGPPGGVRDLLEKAPARIGGFPVRGVWHHISAGPLRGAVILHSPGLFTRKREMLVATVPYLQERMPHLLGPICEAGLVPGARPMSTLAFKDRCRRAVARRFPRARLKWPPWNVRQWSEGGVSSRRCDRLWRSRVEVKRRSISFACRYEPSSGKVTLKLASRRARRRGR